MAKKKIVVSIEEALFEKLEEKSAESGFDSVPEYIEFALGEMINNDDESEYTLEEEDAVKENLKDLGYI